MGWIEELQNINQKPVGLPGMSYNGFIPGSAGSAPFFNQPQMAGKLGGGSGFAGHPSPSRSSQSFPTSYNKTQASSSSSAMADGSYGRGQGVLRSSSPFPDITGMGDLGGGEPEMSAREKAYLEAIMAIRQKSEEKYSYDGANDGLVDEAFQGSLDAISNARNTTNDNYGQSKQMLDNLTNSHVANIKGADRNEIGRISDELTGNYTEAYDKRNQELTADRSAEMAAKVEMLQRLGIQDTGLAGAGDTQTAAIAENAGERKDAMQQADTYKAADLTRNTEMGQNQAAAGVERQSDLRSQLDGILGRLDNSEAEVRNNIASAKLEGRNADRASWDESQRYNQETLIKLQQGEADQANTDADRAFEREMAGAKSQSASKGTASVYDLANDRIRQTGYDPAAYETSYANAMAKGGGALGGSGADKGSYLVQQMLRANPKLDPREVNRYVTAILGYGTDKLNAASQY